MNVRKIGSHEGRDVLEAVLCSGPHKVSIMNYGCVVRDWRYFTGTPNESSGRALVLGFESFDFYPMHSPSFGIIAGRVANRTALGRFKLDNRTIQLACNEGDNHLHGGIQGLGHRLWNLTSDESGRSVRLDYHSPDGEQGYPGAVDFSVTYHLSEEGLACSMHAQPQELTPINLAQHSYYNLSGTSPTINQHALRIEAESYMPVDEAGIPTGEQRAVDGTRFDFRSSRTIADADSQGEGVDHNLVLREDRDQSLPAATLLSPEQDLKLELVSDQPGIQLYTGRKLNLPVPGLDGVHYRAHAGLCLEPQHFPDSLNHPEWPSILYSPDRPYQQDLLMRITSLSTE